MDVGVYICSWGLAWFRELGLGKVKWQISIYFLAQLVLSISGSESFFEFYCNPHFYLTVVKVTGKQVHSGSFTDYKGHYKMYFIKRNSLIQ